MNQDEPLRHLSRDEFERLRSEIRKSREVPVSQEQEPPREPGSVPVPGVNSQSSQPTEATAEIMETGAKIWKMRKAGTSVYTISKRLAIPMTTVHEILRQFEAVLHADVAHDMQHRMTIESDRLDSLIESWSPIALGGPVRVDRVDKHGQKRVDWDVDVPARAAGIVLGAIATKVKLLAACRPEVTNGKDPAGATNVLVWLSQVLPGVSQVVQKIDSVEIPRERLILECSAENEGINNGSNGSNGSPH
jgi:hypothetical protein